MNNEKNFISLDLLIARGPNMEQFLNDVIKYHKDHVKEGLMQRYVYIPTSSFGLQHYTDFLELHAANFMNLHDAKRQNACT